MTLTISKFLEPFFPSPDEPVWLFGFSPKKIPHELKLPELKKQATRNALASNPLLQRNLIEDNKTHGLYFTVNSGGTKIEEINRVNAVFCEIDDLPIQEQHDIFDNCELPPSIRVETLKSVHSYWLLGEKITVEQFIKIQKGLITTFKSDEKIKNPNRVMRLPFFNHVAWDGDYSYKKVSIHTFSETRFSFQELTDAYPHNESSKPIYKESSDDLKTELRRRIFMHKTYRVESNHQWATCQGICHNGEGKTAIAVNLASGYVHCQKGCTFEQILNAFGLELPKKQEKKINLVRRKDQNSKTYEWLKNYVGNR